MADGCRTSASLGPTDPPLQPVEVREGTPDDQRVARSKLVRRGRVEHGRELPSAPGRSSPITKQSAAERSSASASRSGWFETGVRSVRGNSSMSGPHAVFVRSSTTLATSGRNAASGQRRPPDVRRRGDVGHARGLEGLLELGSGDRDDDPDVRVEDMDVEHADEGGRVVARALDHRVRPGDVGPPQDPVSPGAPATGGVSEPSSLQRPRRPPVEGASLARGPCLARSPGRSLRHSARRKYGALSGRALDGRIDSRGLGECYRARTSGAGPPRVQRVHSL